MKRKDIQAVQVYAFYDGRYDPTYSTAQPLLILSTDLYEVGMRGSANEGKLVTPRHGSKMRAGTWNIPAIGLPAIILENPGYVGKVRRDALQAWSYYDELHTEDEGRNTFVGRYTMVTSLAKLVGPYDEVHAEEVARDEAQREANRQAAEHRAAEKDRRDRLRDRLEALGVRASYGVDVSTITFTLDEVEKLVDMAYAGPYDD